jgi:hypothetical protein
MPVSLLPRPCSRSGPKAPMEPRPLCAQHRLYATTIPRFLSRLITVPHGVLMLAMTAFLFVIANGAKRSEATPARRRLTGPARTALQSWTRFPRWPAADSERQRSRLAARSVCHSAVSASGRQHRSCSISRQGQANPPRLLCGGSERGHPKRSAQPRGRNAGTAVTFAPA